MEIRDGMMVTLPLRLLFEAPKIEILRTYGAASVLQHENLKAGKGPGFTREEVVALCVELERRFPVVP